MIRNKFMQESTELAHRAFPINVFHTAFRDRDVLALHWHEHFEIIRVERGQAVIQIGGQHWLGKPGDLIFVNSGELHSVYSPERDFLMYAVVFHPSMTALHASDSDSFELVSPYTAGVKSIAAKLTPGDDHYATLNGMLDLLIAEFRGGEPYYEQSVRALCRAMFACFARWFSEDAADVRLQGFRRKADRFKTLLDVIGRRYMERITLEEAAGIVHLSPYHFCKTFKQLTGLTFVQYVNLHRVQEADRMLRNTSLSVSEIADKVGCGSLQSFSKLYKQLRGASPSRARLRE
ncbi:helix-turn-helix domain-containing protein [Cohnella suwonensis]|uniref:Helix-turn-helix domain-containing protein n=1 Tax=Cohnella suwonensis TaxID=696072 RepID=A0ABW0LZ99_9BACL